MLTYKEPPTPVSGSWESFLSGKSVDGEYFEFRFDGSGWTASWPPIPDECAGPLLDLAAEDIVRAIGYRLDTLPTYPVRLTPEPITVTFDVDPEVLPNAELTMTIRPVTADGG